jgi:hypothetical protein
MKSGVISGRLWIEKLCFAIDDDDDDDYGDGGVGGGNSDDDKYISGFSVGDSLCVL